MLKKNFIIFQCRQRCAALACRSENRSSSQIRTKSQRTVGGRLLSLAFWKQHRAIIKELVVQIRSRELLTKFLANGLDDNWSSSLVVGYYSLNSIQLLLSESLGEALHLVDSFNRFALVRNHSFLRFSHWDQPARVIGCIALTKNTAISHLKIWIY